MHNSLSVQQNDTVKHCSGTRAVHSPLTELNDTCVCQAIVNASTFGVSFSLLNDQMNKTREFAYHQSNLNRHLLIESSNINIVHVP